MINKSQHYTPPLGFIIAGGTSSRMGRDDKLLLSICGSNILNHVINRLSPQLGSLIVNANREDLNTSLEVIPDLIKNSGPLGGIYTALKTAKERGFSKVITSPADTPFIPKDFVSRLETYSSKPIVVAKSQGRVHPILALWDTTLLSDTEWALNKGERKILSWIEKYSPAQIEWIDGPDPFFNINTPEDLAQAKKRLSQGSL